MGILRDILFARNFGASAYTDIYFASFLFSDILLLLCISSAIMGISTPLFLREKQKNTELGYKTFGQFFLVLNLLFLVVITLAYFFLPELLWWLYPQYMNVSEYQSILLNLSGLALISNFCFALSNTLGSFLMAHKHFFSTALAPLFYNLGIIGGIIFFSDQYGIYAAGYGAVIGAMFHLLLRLVEYKYYKERFSLNFNANSSVLKELLVSMITRWPAVVIFPALTFFFFAQFSITYQEGAYSLFSYARNITFAPVAIFAIAITTSSFPVFSDLFANKRYSELSQKFWEAFTKILFWILPFTVGILFLGPLFYNIIYDISLGSLSEDTLFSLFFILSISLLFESFTNLFSRFFNALGDTKTPLFSSLMFFGTVVFGSYMLYSYFNNVLLALAAAYTLGFLFQSIFYFLSLYRIKTLTWKNPFSLFFLAPLGMIGYFLVVEIFLKNLLFLESPIFIFIFHAVVSSFVFFCILWIIWRKKTFSYIKSML